MWSSSGGAVLFVGVFVDLFSDLTTVSPHEVKNQPFFYYSFLNIWNNKKKDIFCDVIVGVQEIQGFVFQRVKPPGL